MRMAARGGRLRAVAGLSLALVLAGALGACGHDDGGAPPASAGALVGALDASCRATLDRALEPARYAAEATSCAARIASWDELAEGLEARLADGAARAAPLDDASVDCAATDDWADVVREVAEPDGRVLAGAVLAGDDTMHLAPATCLALDAVAATPASLACLADARAICGPDAVEGAIALVTLAHEAQHAAGEGDEAAAQCRAIQTVDDVAASLGVPAAPASRVGPFVTHALLQPAAYRSAECRAGGALDLEPATPAFP
jgi:hypothetical protein